MAEAYYNEIDPDAVAILRQLMSDDVIAPGDVDDRSIKDVKPDDLDGYTQAHFFAGGGLWSVAARLAGWPDDRPLWTGSCPCQPFSAAGKRRGTDDPRHLWPDFHRLIRARRPPVIVGEQVAGKAGRGWFDGVRSDLAGNDYTSRAIDIPACAVDSPQQRNRLWWLAMAGAGDSERRARPELGGRDCGPSAGWVEAANTVGKPDARDRALGGGDSTRLQECEREAVGGSRRWQERRAARQPDSPPSSRNGSWWADAERLDCLDGKTRRSKPGVCLLVDGLPGRVGLWRVAGNAISPILAAEVIAAFMETAG